MTSIYILGINFIINQGVSKMDKYIFGSDVREILGGISRTTLWRWIKLGYFPKPRKVGPRKGWLLSDVNSWVLSRRFSK